MTGKGIENEASAALEDMALGTDRKERAYLSALSSFACDFDRKFGDSRQRATRRVRSSQVDLVENRLQRRRRGSHRVLVLRGRAGAQISAGGSPVRVTGARADRFQVGAVSMRSHDVT